jgi:hypothetical protein
MGYRTVVVLNNDSPWSDDPLLGKKINHAASLCRADKPCHFEHGSVAECLHADVQTIGVVESLGFTPIARHYWNRDETTEQMLVKMLKEAARELGYRVSKIPEKKTR